MTSRPRANHSLALRAATLLIITSMFLSGCIGAVRDYYSFEPEDHYVNPGVFPGTYRPADQGSTVLNQRRLVVGDPEIYRLPSAVPHSAVSGQPEAPAESTVYITIATWLPTNGSASTFPVIMVAGPDFEVDNESMRTADDEPPENPFSTAPRGNPTVRWLLRNFVPLGYAVAIVGVRGTGTSGGCMEFLGPREAADLDQAVRFLATQEWSNGNVGMFGIGYDAATQWLVAASGNEYLKTIVPVGGWADTFSALFHNGTVETGAASTHTSFWYRGIGQDNVPPRPDQLPEPGFPVPPGFWINPFNANGREAYQDRQNLVCDEAYEGFASSYYSNTAGDRGPNDFWAERDYRQRVLESYDGSVFMIHGLQDLTVDPHNAMPFNDQLRQSGIDVKEWYGQWWHQYPDSECPRRLPVWLAAHCRWDFAETLLHWFDYYLKDNQTVDLGPPIQIQDNRGYWRNAGSFPPNDASWLGLHLHGNGSLSEGSSPERIVTLAPPFQNQAGVNAPRNLIELKTEPFPVDTRISGLPQLQVAFETRGPGGAISAWLLDENAEGNVLDRWFENESGLYMPISGLGLPPVIGRAQMDLRFHEGGDESKPTIPGQRYTARIEFEPLDVLIPAGHRLTLWLLQYPYPDDDPATIPSAVDVVLGDASTLRLPLITVDVRDTFPVPGSRFPTADYYDWPHVRKPDYPELAQAPVFLAQRTEE